MASWLKLWIDPSLDGPIRMSLTPAERGVYYDLQLLAKKCGMGGRLCAETGQPYSERWIAARLNVGRRLVSNTVHKCTTLGLISGAETCITLVAFNDTQSDYYRQKQYRHAGLTESGENLDPDKYVKQRYGHMVQR